MLSIALFNFYAECRYAQCRYAECHYAECSGAALAPVAAQGAKISAAIVAVTAVFTMALCHFKCGVVVASLSLYYTSSLV